MNVIVLLSDTFRYDYLGCNGNTSIRTPNLDRFARRAVSFERHYLSSFPTIPNRTDLFTGRFSFPFHGWRPLDRDIPVLSTLFGEAGYGTQLIADTPHLMSRGHHFDRGFDGAHWIRGQEGDRPLLKGNLPPRLTVPADARTRVDEHMRGTRFGNLATLHTWTNRDWAWEEDRFCVRTARTVSRWLEENHDAAPFLLWVDFFDVHEPWDPPEYLVRRYDSSGYGGPPQIHPNYGPASAYSKKELANLRAHYAAEVHLVDKWIGHVLTKIGELDLWRDSIVVFTSDHGMLLGEHNRTGKSNIHPDDQRVWPLYRELAHIPLLIAAPGAAEGSRVSQLTQSVDLLPTFLDLSGVDYQGPRLHGHVLTPLLKAGSSRRMAAPIRLQLHLHPQRRTHRQRQQLDLYPSWREGRPGRAVRYAQGSGAEEEPGPAPPPRRRPHAARPARIPAPGGHSGRKLHPARSGGRPRLGDEEIGAQGRVPPSPQVSWRGGSP